MDEQTQQNFDAAFYVICGILGTLVVSAVLYVFCGGDRIRAWYNEKYVTDKMRKRTEARDNKRRAKMAIEYGSVV